MEGSQQNAVRLRSNSVHILTKAPAVLLISLEKNRHMIAHYFQISPSNVSNVNMWLLMLATDDRDAAPNVWLIKCSKERAQRGINSSVNGKNVINSQDILSV